jgi:hypothetical protein
MTGVLRTITVSDNGIGMSRQEVIDHIGTIAKSGTHEFLHALTSHQAIVELISATTTTTGLTVTAELDTSAYPTGLRYTSKQVSALPIGKHDFHPDWNYTIRPEPHETPIPSRK